MCEACELIVDFTSGKNYSDYIADKACKSSVERQFIILGEAMNRMGKLCPDIAKEIPDSRPIISFRNILVHSYDKIEDEVVWGIVKRYLPELHTKVRQMLSDSS